MPIVDMTVCNDASHYGGSLKSPVMICAGYTTGGVDTCQVNKNLNKEVALVLMEPRALKSIYSLLKVLHQSFNRFNISFDYRATVGVPLPVKKMANGKFKELSVLAKDVQMPHFPGSTLKSRRSEIG